MNNKFSLLLALGLLVAGPATVLAQAGKSVPRVVDKSALTGVAAPPADVVATRADALTANMAQALGLTPAQTEKVRAINVGSVRTVEAARLRYRQEPGPLRARIEEVGLARLEQLKDVLTPAQFSRYQQKREEKMGIPTVRGIQGTPPPGLGGRGEDN